MNIQRLLQILDGVQDPSLRKPFLELTLAIELAYSAPLPHQPVQGAVAYFEEFYAELVKRVIGEVNELYPFSVNVCYNLVVDAYVNRYRICHEPHLLTAEQIISHLNSAEFEQTLTPAHKASLAACGYTKLLRSELKEFIGRFIG